MVFQLRSSQYQSQSLKPIATAHLAQTMTLLSLNIKELQQQIENELASNPALEILDDRRCPNCNRHLPQKGFCPHCSFNNSNDVDGPIVFVSPPERSYASRSYQQEDFLDNAYPVETEDLATYVLQQISTELGFEDRPIAAHLLSSLDEDGLLTCSLVEVAKYYHISLSKVEQVAKLIHKADPIGVGCSSPKEALLVQLEMLEATTPFPELTARAIEEGLELIGKNRYKDLAKILGTTTPIARKISNYISDNLNPFPARAHWGNTRHKAKEISSTYRQPDVVIHQQDNKDDNRLIIEVLYPISGTLRINPLFKQALKNLSSEQSNKWRAAIEQANLLVKCLAQRNHTLVRLMERLAVLQKEFILKGDAHLKPITRARIAKELEVHESTISRAVSGKTAQLPSKQIIPIARFFDRSLHIRTLIKDIIEKEVTPLSDSKISKILSEHDITVARRTVAKYRNMEGILPAHLRRSSSA
jgi:RNA polymerase sigma-54 factor